MLTESFVSQRSILINYCNLSRILLDLFLKKLRNTFLSRIVYHRIIEINKELLFFFLRQHFRLIQLFAVILYRAEQQIHEMPMQQPDFFFRKAIAQIVIMNTEFSFVVPVLNMYLQMLRLHSAVVPRRFISRVSDVCILIAQHYIIQLFLKAELLTDIGQDVAIVVPLMTEYRKSGIFCLRQILCKGFFILQLHQHGYGVDEHSRRIFF